MSSPVHNKVYLVTGSASGMGLATAHTLLFRGAKLAACDINEKNLEEFYSNLEAAKQMDTLTGLVDVRNKSDLRKFAQQAKSHFGRLDGVANFAGTGGHELGTESVWETSDDEGVIDTPMHRANVTRVKNFVPAPTTPIARDGTAQEVANVVVFLLGTESSFVTDDAWSVDGGANA
ncbi:hypothetical protein BJX96DRAFT_176831 [Aspergillus floccosus]